MPKKKMKCTIKGCDNELWWQGDKVFKTDAPGTRKHYVCGDHLPINGLPEDWPNRDPKTPISTEYNDWS
jgi:hypothetical protein